MLVASTSPIETNRLTDIANFIKSVGGTVVETISGVRGSQSTSPTTVGANLPSGSGTGATPEDTTMGSFTFILIGAALIIIAVITGILFRK